MCTVGDAGGPGADHQGSGHEAVLSGPAEGQAARPQLRRDPPPAPVGEDEPGRLPGPAHHVRLDRLETRAGKNILIVKSIFTLIRVNGYGYQSFNHFNPSILFVGKAFAENSSSTSLQRVAMRRVVSLSSGYFLHEDSPTTI